VKDGSSLRTPRSVRAKLIIETFANAILHGEALISPRPTANQPGMLANSILLSSSSATMDLPLTGAYAQHLHSAGEGVYV